MSLTAGVLRSRSLLRTASHSAPLGEKSSCRSPPCWLPAAARYKTKERSTARMERYLASIYVHRGSNVVNAPCLLAPLCSAVCLHWRFGDSSANHLHKSSPHDAAAWTPASEAITDRVPAVQPHNKTSTALQSPWLLSTVTRALACKAGKLPPGDRLQLASPHLRFLQQPRPTPFQSQECPVRTTFHPCLQA